MFASHCALLRCSQYISDGAARAKASPRLSDVWGMGGEADHQRPLANTAVIGRPRFITEFPDRKLIRQSRWAKSAAPERVSKIFLIDLHRRLGGQFGISKAQRYGTIRYKLTGTLHFLLANYSAVRSRSTADGFPTSMG